MEEKKYLDLDMLALYDALIKKFVNSKMFVGTYEQYETANANGEIPLNSLVIITDDETSSGSGDSSGDSSSTSTSSLLGTGVLGYMILG